MITKKTVAAAAIAVGLTATAGASYATAQGDDDATSRADQAQLKVNKTVNKSAKDGSDAALRCGKKAASMRETKKLNVYMPLKKAQRILGSKGRKVSGNKLRAWNTCYEEYSDLYLHSAKRKGKFYVYTVSAPIR